MDKGLLLAIGVTVMLVAVVQLVRPDTPSDDRDEDGLSDSWEMRYFGSLDPERRDDPDGDGATNADEQRSGTDPTRGTIGDTDGDGLPDDWERRMFVNDLSYDGADDPDGDGCDNLCEFEGDTDPNSPPRDPCGASTAAHAEDPPFSACIHDSRTTSPPHEYVEAWIVYDADASIPLEGTWTATHEDWTYPVTWDDRDDDGRVSGCDRFSHPSNQQDAPAPLRLLRDGEKVWEYTGFTAGTGTPVDPDGIPGCTD